MTQRPDGGPRSCYNVGVNRDLWIGIAFFLLMAAGGALLLWINRVKVGAETSRDARRSEDLTLARHVAVARGDVAPKRLPVVADPAARVELYDASRAVPERAPAVVARGPEAPIVAVAYSPDGAQVIAGAWDRTLWTFDAESGHADARQRGFAGIVRGLALLPDGWAAVASWADHESRGRAVTLVEIAPSDGVAR